MHMHHLVHFCIWEHFFTGLKSCFICDVPRVKNVRSKQNKYGKNDNGATLQVEQCFPFGFTSDPMNCCIKLLHELLSILVINEVSFI